MNFRDTPTDMLVGRPLPGSSGSNPPVVKCFLAEIQMTPKYPTEPFGATCSFVHSLLVSKVRKMYLNKCGYDPARCFHGLDAIHLFECSATGMKFWTPDVIAGDEMFYEELSGVWKNYYREERWEYEPARNRIKRDLAQKDSITLLEIGCGRGFFLRSVEDAGVDSLGLELNAKAIRDKVTDFDVQKQSIKERAKTNPASADAIVSFQVLEHVINAGEFLKNCIEVLKPGGLLLFSTPNHANPVHERYGDAFDLPPHHVNYFTADVFDRIGSVLGLRVEGIEFEPFKISPGSLVRSDQFGAMTNLLIRAYNRALKTIRPARAFPGIGRTVLAAFRKPSE